MTRISAARRLDVALAFGFVILTAWSAVTSDVPWLGAVLMTLPAASLALRRDTPLVTPLLLLGLTAAADSLGISNDAIESLPQLGVWIAGIYACAAYLPTRNAVVGLGLWLAVGCAEALAFGEDAADLAFSVVLVISIWVPGLVVRRQRLHTEMARTRAERERARAERAVADERARIARELHDVVAHAVGIMVVQAGAAERVLEADPDRARQALTAVQDTGRTAVAELGRMLGLLRGTEEWDRAPLPTLATLDSLVGAAREAGLTVEVNCGTGLQDLPPAIDLSAYRIVQEAVTNAIKHAPGSTVSIDIQRRGDEIRVEVSDDGAGRYVDALGTGHGLAGLRERVAVFGGVFEAGRLGSGFRVLARLPVSTFAEVDL